MVKTIMAGLLLFNICILKANAQTSIKKNANNKAEPIHISVQLNGYKTGKDSIHVTFWKDHVYGTRSNGAVTFTVMPDKNGKFSINLPAIDHPGRISIFDWIYDISICNLQLIEPGDNIQIVVQIPESDEEDAIIKFSGKGAPKYECCKLIAINPITDYQSFTIGDNSYHQALKAADSLLQAKLKVIKRYKDRLSTLAYSIIAADVKGQVYQVMGNIIGMQGNSNKREADAISKQNVREAFRELQTHANPVNNDDLVLSIGYIEFLYNLTKLELVLVDNIKSYSFKQLYDKLRSNYSGTLREKLLAHALFNSLDQMTLFSGIDIDVYTNCLKDALSLTKSDYLKDVLTKRLNTRGKGANALNFRLPADSSGRIVSLSDLKGKIVLVDMWGYVCTACYMFSQVFHEKIYPQFKDNPDFVVVSIMLDDYADKERYMRRLRGEGKYTSTEYINLYAGKGEEAGRLLSKHYDIDAVPFLLLVDKEGKIYSSTLPFFTYTSSTQKIEELTALIKEALNSQSSAVKH